MKNVLMHSLQFISPIAMEAKNVTIEILEAQIIIPADAGMAAIRMRRQGFLAIATAVK